MTFTVDITFGITVEAASEIEACEIAQRTIEFQYRDVIESDYTLEAWAE